MSKYIEADRLKAKIERLKAAVKQNSIGKFTSVGFIRACDDILFTIDSLIQEESGAWIEVSEDHPLPYGQEVIGYNKEWVNEDFNPSGTRIGFFSDAGFSQPNGLMTRIVMPLVSKRGMIILSHKCSQTEQ